MTLYDGIDDVPSGRYSVIYADPPWRYTYWREGGGKGRAAANHYTVRDAPEIAAMGVGRIAAKDCWLWIWVTWPLLFESEQVINGWGFKYSTCGINWRKVNEDGSPYTGMGYSVRSSSEICLLARRGSPRIHSRRVNQCLDEYAFDDGDALVTIKEPIGRHSEKPKSAYRNIVEICGDVPRIELFCRGLPADGWDAMGDEVDRKQRRLA